MALFKLPKRVTNRCERDCNPLVALDGAANLCRPQGAWCICLQHVLDQSCVRPGPRPPSRRGAGASYKPYGCPLPPLIKITLPVNLSGKPQDLFLLLNADKQPQPCLNNLSLRFQTREPPRSVHQSLVNLDI